MTTGFKRHRANDEVIIEMKGNIILNKFLFIKKAEECDYIDGNYKTRK